MGILDFMGHVAGKMAAMGKEAMEYKKEYENLLNEVEEVLKENKKIIG